MRNRNKTDYGYIDYRKKRQLFMTAIMVLIGIAIYFLGCALNKGESTNIFTVVAILMVLPGAKYFVNFIVLFPYQTPEKEKYQELTKLLEFRGELYSDLVITSPEKIMNLDFLWLEEGCVFGVLGKKGQDLSYIQNYVSQGVKNWTSNYKVKIYAEYKEFYEELKKEQNHSAKEPSNELEKARDYLKSLIV